MRIALILSLVLGLLAACGVDPAAAPRAKPAEKPSAQAAKPIRVLITGGGSSHDFKHWYGDVDAATIRELPGVTVTYTEQIDTIAPLLADTDVLCIANNKSFGQAGAKQAIMAFADQGKGLVLLHAGMWYSWADWPQFNQVLVGGGARDHDRIAPFDVKVTDAQSPIMQGVPATFSVTDELYHTLVDNAGTPMKPLLTAYSKLTNQTYASVFIVQHPKARIVGIALGHDGGAHNLAAYQQILKNSIEWAAGR